MMPRRSSVVRYGHVAVVVLPVVRKFIGDKQLREDFRHVIRSSQRVSGHIRGKGARKKAQMLVTDAEVSNQDERFVKALGDAINRVRRRATVEKEQHRWGRWLMVSAAVASFIYLGGRSDVWRRIKSMVRPESSHTDVAQPA